MEKDLGAEFIALAHRFKRLNMEGLFTDLSRGEFFLLQMIHSGCLEQEKTEGVYVSRIAAHMKVTPSAISRMLKGLEERAFIERKVDKNDRRNTYVCLTSEGEQMRKKIEVQMNDFTRNVLEAMGEEEAKLLVTLFNRMIDVVEVELKKHTEKS